MAAFYGRLVAAGEPKAAVVACMRKLLTIAYGVLKAHTPLDPARGSRQGYAEIEAGVAISATARLGKAVNRRVVAARLESSSRRYRWMAAFRSDASTRGD